MKESNKNLIFGLFRGFSWHPTFIMLIFTWPGWVKIFNTLLQGVLFSDCKWVPPRAFLPVPIGTAQCAVNHSSDFHGMVDQAFSEERYYCVIKGGVGKVCSPFLPMSSRVFLKRQRTFLRAGNFVMSVYKNPKYQTFKWQYLRNTSCKIWEILGI